MIPGISFKGIGVPDFSRQLVTAHDLNGKATGDPLSDMVFPSHVLAAKCKQIEEKEKEAILEKIDAALLGAEASVMGMDYLMMLSMLEHGNQLGIHFGPGKKPNVTDETFPPGVPVPPHPRFGYVPSRILSPIF